MRVYECSVYSDAGVFASMLRERGALSETEWRVYRDWQMWLLDRFEPKLRLDRVMYLHASPEHCAERIVRRGCEEERGISLENLERLHEKHEAWLLLRRREDVRGDLPVLVLDG